MGIEKVGPVSVAWTASDRVSVTADLPGLLCESDRERAEALTPKRRAGLLAGRLLIHALVAEQFPHATGWSVVPRRCPRCGQPHAGPEVQGVPALASLSHSGGMVVAALAPSTQVCRLGVDVELDVVDGERNEDLQRLLGHSTERVLRRWTRVEAVLKADGRGLLVDPGAVWLRRGGAWIAGQTSSYLVAEVPGPAGYLISLAWTGAAAPAGASPRATPRTGGPAGARWSARRA